MRANLVFHLHRFHHGHQITSDHFSAPASTATRRTVPWIGLIRSAPPCPSGRTRAVRVPFRRSFRRSQLIWAAVLHGLAKGPHREATTVHFEHLLVRICRLRWRRGIALPGQEELPGMLGQIASGHAALDESLDRPAPAGGRRSCSGTPSIWNSSSARRARARVSSRSRPLMTSLAMSESYAGKTDESGFGGGIDAHTRTERETQPR